MGVEIRPFRIQVSEADLEDLKKRLRATRWPPTRRPSLIGRKGFLSITCRKSANIGRAITIGAKSKLGSTLSLNFTPTWMGSASTSCLCACSVGCVLCVAPLPRISYRMPAATPDQTGCQGGFV